MKSKRALTTAALVLLSFSATLAIVWMQGAPPGPQPAALPARPSPKSSPGGWSVAHLWAAMARDESRPTAVLPDAPPVAAATGDSAPPSDDQAPPLPVYFTVSSHPGIGSTDSGVDDGTAPADRSGVLRQVDIVNNSDEVLQITVVALNVPTQQTTQAHLFLRPHHQEHAGSALGLKLEPGDQVTLRSSGYRQLSGVVP